MVRKSGQPKKGVLKGIIRTYRVPREVYETYKEICRRKGTTVSQEITFLIMGEIAKEFKFSKELKEISK